MSDGPLRNFRGGGVGVCVGGGSKKPGWGVFWPHILGSGTPPLINDRRLYSYYPFTWLLVPEMY